MSLLARARYELTALLHGATFLRQVKREAVRQLIGHDRIIGWEGGLPVRSLTIPAEYSPAFALSAARLYNSLRTKVASPGIASLSVTDRCDCSCPHCFAFDQPGADLTASAWADVIRQAMDLGVFTFVINGGEPLLHPELARIVSAIDPRSATCLLYTNGSRLAERATELRRAGLSRVAIALDSADPAAHDRHRGHPGLFNKLMAGYAEARRLGMLVGFSTFATPERLEDGTLEGIFEFARCAGAPEVIVYDALPSGKLQNCTELKRPNSEYRQRLKLLIETWWARTDAPGIWWYGHVSSSRNFGCSGGLSMFSVSHSGEVRPCDFCRTTVGRVQEHRLEELWDRLNRRARTHRAEHGPGCLLMEPDGDLPSSPKR